MMTSDRNMFFKWLVVLLLCMPVTVFAQVDEEDEPEQEEQNVIKGNVVLEDIDKIIESYEYDPESDRYIYSKKYEDYNINYPIILTREEYEALLLKRNMRTFFRQKMSATEGRLSEEEQQDMLPMYTVNSKLFESIFGSNTIDIKPSGSLELDLGVRYSKQDNPMISPRNRSVFALSFDPRISVGLQGKVGTNMDVNINYDTQSQFGMQQQMAKLNYQPGEDDILQALEVGNVSMPINNSLVRGAQNLFGVKSTLQFGPTTVTGVFSRQNSERRTIVAEGGGMVEEFELFALDYDANRHFFLSQFFRNKYDEALENYPFINSRVRITRVEVWVTNRQNRLNEVNNNQRNIVAIQDLGESRLMNANLERTIVTDLNLHPGFFNVPADTPPNNQNNQYDPRNIGNNFLNESLRNINTIASGFNIQVTEGKDYVKLENARKLNSSDFTFHPQLGYISLRQPLNNNEVLAVAYEYTIGGEVYRVGEFGTDGVDANVTTQDDNGDDIPATQSIILKMLKSSLTSTDQPVWDLMMKNIYQIGGGGYQQISQEGFLFNILYTDPQPLNYIAPVGSTPLPEDVESTALLNVFHLDRLNNTNDPQQGGDGYFDFISSSMTTNPDYNSNSYGGNQGGYQGGRAGGMGSQGGQMTNTNTFDGITIDPRNGLIIFTTVEPFGKYLFDKLSTNSGEDYEVDASYNDNQKKYVFRDLYRRNATKALQDSQKNKFQMKGKYRSSGTGGGINVGYNVQPGSVTVTASGRTLIEGQDYNVDYQSGRVEIINPSLENSQIEISVESNNMFNQTQKTFFGVHVDHKFNENFSIGGTYLRLSEQPLTIKSAYGQEAVNNTILGFNANYYTEAPFLTRWVNKLPNVDTDAMSDISLKGEFAYLIPGASNRDQLNGEATSFVDSFEGSHSNISLLAPNSWYLSSVPVGFGEQFQDLQSGYRRAKMAWYRIDPIFYSPSRRPNGITDVDLASNRTRRILKEEIFPSMDVAAGELLVINTLDLTYYPKERGPYNFNPEYLSSSGSLNPSQNWAGIMRSMSSPNFEQNNIEYVEFWMMDPYTGNPGDVVDITNEGSLYLNFGYISEDILQDGLKQYENGLPGADNSTPTISSDWGRVPASTALIYAFDTDPNNRRYQDAGLDGFLDDDERAKFPDFAHLDDPSADNYEFFLTASGNIIQRYRNYNGLEGNNPIEFSDNNRGNNNIPDKEDIDGDNTMNTINAYYEYKVEVKPNPVVGENYVTDVRLTDAQLADGSTTPVKWVQYKVPIQANPDRAVGAIADLQSIQFMRMYVTDFSDEVTLRFASLDLVKSMWYRYEKDLVEDPTLIVDGSNTGFDVQSVNVIDNFSRQPIPYVMPPGIDREQINQNNTVINQNEQSLSLTVYQQNKNIAVPSGLEPGDSRAVFKNFYDPIDMRSYKKMRMFLHAEALDGPEDPTRLEDDELVAFIRFGNDFTDNFYQIEVPLKLTEWGQSSAYDVWPLENEIEVQLELLTKLKLAMRSDPNYDPSRIYFKYEDEIAPELVSPKPNRLRIGVKGNPNYGLVRTMMLGVRNQTDILYQSTAQQPKDVRGEVWFNELRLSDMDNSGGWAALATMDANIADVASISASVNTSTSGFGALEQGPQERSRADVFQYGVATSVNADKFLPKKWNVTLPISYSVSEEFITPEWDPNDPDVKLQDAIDYAQSQEEKDRIKDRAVEHTKRTSINFTGVRKNLGENQKERFYNIENFTLSHSYSKLEQKTFEIEKLVDQQARTSLDYNYGFKPWNIEPFKNSKEFKQKKYFKWLTDFNLNLMPSNVTFNTNIVRQLNQQKYRMIDIQGIEIQPLYRRNYFFNYGYGLNFKLTKSINVQYTVNNNNLVRNYMDDNYYVDNSLGIWDGYFDMGQHNTHMQQFNASYQLPFSKIPFLAFINGTYTYTSNFHWQRSSDAMSNIYLDGNYYNLGNTIQNSNKHQLNTRLDMGRFYKYIGLEPTKNKKKTLNSRTASTQQRLRPGQKLEANAMQGKQEGNEEEEKEGSAFVDALINLATSVKNVQLSYTESNGTVLPGYLPGLGFFGSSKPTLGFVFGSQEDVRYLAARNGWLTNYQGFNQMYSEVHQKSLSFKAEVRPLNDLVIDLTANMQESNSMSEQYDVDSNGFYNSRSPYEFGNYSISTIMLPTAFGRSDINGSEVFDAFRNSRQNIAFDLARQRGIDLSDPNNIDEYGYPVGYGRTSQDVLIPAFISAYTGQNSDKLSGFKMNIPLPNWNITYSGLSKLPWLKDKFTNFTIKHQYQSSYSVNSFQTNYDYIADPDALNAAGNYPSPTVVGNINMIERFMPLVEVGFTTKSAFSFKARMDKDRMLSLSFDNNLLTEVQGNTYSVEVGFRIKDVAINTDFAEAGNGGRIVSDVDVVVNFSWRKNKTYIRYLDFDNTQLGGGQDNWMVNLRATYTFSKNFQGDFFYEHMFNNAVISTMYPITNIRSGVTLRYNFAN